MSPADGEDQIATGDEPGEQAKRKSKPLKPTPRSQRKLRPASAGHAPATTTATTTANSQGESYAGPVDAAQREQFFRYVQGYADVKLSRTSGLKQTKSPKPWVSHIGPGSPSPGAPTARSKAASKAAPAGVGSGAAGRAWPCR